MKDILLPVTSTLENRSTYFLFFFINLRNFWQKKKTKMLKWRFESIFEHKKRLREMWESRLAEFGFYYVLRVIENVIRRTVFCNMLCVLWNITYHIIQLVLNRQFNQLHKNKSSKEISFRFDVQTIKRTIYEPHNLKLSSCADL